jgi:NTP pyrophosphatase (non-canonical NTP hydrolase)
MNFKELIPAIHSNAIAKGFWKEEGDKRKPLMLVISEIGEAVEAHRKGLMANKEQFIKDLSISDFKDAFKTHMKDSMGDELADVVIRLLDYSGKYAVRVDKIISAYSNEVGKKSVEHYEEALAFAKSNHARVNSSHVESHFKEEIKLSKQNIKCVPSHLFTTVRIICEIYHKAFPGQYIGEAIGRIQNLCTQMNIDLEYHIQIKMKFNATREYLHGKSY